MENNKNAFVDKWSSVYFFIPLFEKPIVMPTAEEFCSKLSEKFGRVTELSEEQKMPEDPAGLKSFVLWDHLVHYSKENQDLPSQLPESICHLQDSQLKSLGIHKVKMEPGSMLGELLGKEVYTNTFHHQGIRDLSPELRAVGWTNDGVIEAVETEDGMIYAVQWHPERMYREDPVFAGLFTRLIRLASERQ